MKAKRELIRDHYEHGEQFTVGAATAKAVRLSTYEGWMVFRYVNGVSVRGQTDDPMSYGKAKRVAREWAETYGTS